MALTPPRRATAALTATLVLALPSLAIHANPASAQPAAVTVTEDRAPSDLPTRIAKLEAAIKLERERAIALISRASAEDTSLHDDKTLRQIAKRLPDLQTRLRQLQAKAEQQRDQPSPQ